MKIFARSTLLTAAPLLTAAALLALPLASPAQAPAGGHGAPADAKPLPSPAAAAEVTLDRKPIIVHYNSPRVRGRVIMGGVVPYDKVWRTGANPATSFVTEGDLKIGDLSVPAGKYTLFTLPEEPGKPWMLIVSKETGEWGLAYKQGMDLGRTPMRSATLPAPQEDMTISFEKTTRNSTQLHIKWDTIDEWVKIEAARNADDTRP